MADDASIPPRIREHLARLYPTLRAVACEPLAPDAGEEHATTKAAGYGEPMRIALAGDGGEVREVVWHVAGGDEFGHERRSDRVANLLLASEDFARVPEHAAALDVGVIGPDGAPRSLLGCGEPYLLTDYVRGTIYADDLRRVARERTVTPLDLARVDALARYLVRLHTPIDDPVRYRRAIRDLVGHGEGIFGIVDGYPAEVEGTSQEQLRAIERKCADWRWRLRLHEGRLVRTHGDFHPFNVVFRDGTGFAVLDASRGTCGDAADDVTAMAINYVLFALDAPEAWRNGLGVLWRELWGVYTRERGGDPSLAACAPPFFAWRALVVCNPHFYPALSAPGRRALLGLAEGALDAGHFDPAWADELFA